MARFNRVVTNRLTGPFAGRLPFHYSVGFDLDERARTAITALPETAWAAVLDDEGHARDLSEAGAAELTGLLRESAGGDQLPAWPARMRVLLRREKPGSGAPDRL